MIRIPYELIAEERLILSRTSASAGLHECLDFVPGSALLGAAAARFYPAWKKSDPANVFAMFHSGEVSFGDAHPHDATGNPTLPVPFSLHHAKPRAGQEAKTFQDCEDLGKRINANHVLNLAIADHPKDGQWQQLRAGWVGPDGLLHQVKSGHVMKTARDSERLGAPDDGRLFGFSYIEAGQIFSGSILVDDTREALAKELRTWIGSGREIQVGRSHRAEFGRCLLRIADSSTSSIEEDLDDQNTLSETLVLLAHSDWWLPAGLPTTGAALHPELSGYELLSSKTFVRFRRYASWNSFRGYPDPERQVIARGSVVTLKSSGTPSAITLGHLRKTLLRDGIGAGQTEGLGRVLVRPPVLAGDHPYFVDPREFAINPVGRVVRPESPYLARIEDRWIRSWVQVAADSLANELVQTWGAFRPSPRKSQWATLRTMAANSKDAEQFKAEFNAYAAVGAAKWKWSGTTGGAGNQTLAETVVASWEANESKIGGGDPRAKAGGAKNKVFLTAVAEAARRLRDR